VRLLIDTMYIKNSYVPWNFNGKEAEGVRSRGRRSQDSRICSMEADLGNRHSGSEQCETAGIDVPP
jgi:hypothetical protein